MENKTEKLIEKRKVKIAVATGLAVGAAIGGAVIYAMNGDSIKLGKILKEFGKNAEGQLLTDILTEYANGSNRIDYTTPKKGVIKTMAELGEGAKILIDDAVENGRSNNNVVALMVFTKKVK